MDTNVDWATLNHAYGPASGIPELLRQLAAFPDDTSYNAEPYFSLWSALCHQGDVYSASYAAVPFIVRMIEGNAEKANWHPLALIAAIEIGRAKGNGPPLRPDLAQPYNDALRNVPKMLASLAFREWDELFCRAAAALLVATKGQSDLADCLLDREK